MADDVKKTEIENQKTRRTIVKTAAQVAVTAPAVGLLLSASTKPAAAQVTAYQASQFHILDDFTSGNTHEDIDAIELHTNTNPLTGQQNQDDVFVP